jgi:hypothetical protein
MEEAIRALLSRYLDGATDLATFEDAFAPISCEVERSGEPDAISLANTVEGLLAEASSAEWTEYELREELSQLNRPFVLPIQAGLSLRPRELFISDKADVQRISPTSAWVTVSRYRELALVCG